MAHLGQCGFTSPALACYVDAGLGCLAVRVRREK